METILNTFCKLIVDEIGLGYTENVYQNALKVLLTKNNYSYEEEVIIPINFLNNQIGFVRADLIIDKKVIIEMKVISKITEKETNQVERYKHLLNIDEAYIINFNYKEYIIYRV